jgi:hypothetical protein
MAGRYRTPGGWTVEVVQLAAGERLRIRHHGFYVADVASVDGLARCIPAVELEQLEREPLILAAWPQRRPRYSWPGHGAGDTRPTCTHRPGIGQALATSPQAPTSPVRVARRTRREERNEPTHCAAITRDRQPSEIRRSAWRRMRDSNSRGLAPNTLSKRAP